MHQFFFSFLFILSQPLFAQDYQCKKAIYQLKKTLKEEPFDYAKRTTLFISPLVSLVEMSKKSSPEQKEFLIIGQPSKAAYPKLIQQIEDCAEKEKNFIWLKEFPNRVIPTSTSYVAMMELLELEKKIVGFPQTKNISSKRTRQLIAAKKITDLTQPFKVEEIIKLEPEAILGYTFSHTEENLKQKVKLLKTQFINLNEYEEVHPLGRAEWIKVIGVIFNRLKMSQEIFNGIKNRYLAVKQEGELLSKKKRFFVGVINGSSWEVHGGESYFPTILKDAGGIFVYKNNKKEKDWASHEEILKKKYLIDTWVLNMNWKSKDEIARVDKNYKILLNNKKIKVFTPTNEKSTVHGYDFFETGVTRPDLLIEEFFKIFNREKLNNEVDLRWYKLIN